MTPLNIAMGFFFGIFLGVGCALAVMYSIYTGGYRKAIADSLCDPRPAKYTQLLQKAQAQEIK